MLTSFCYSTQTRVTVLECRAVSANMERNNSALPCFLHFERKHLKRCSKMPKCSWKVIITTVNCNLEWTVMTPKCTVWTRMVNEWGRMTTKRTVLFYTVLLHFTPVSPSVLQYHSSSPRYNQFPCLVMPKTFIIIIIIIIIKGFRT